MTDLTRHPQYTANDLAYLRAKGWTDQQISDRWDMERAVGHGPCGWETNHDKLRAVVGYIPSHAITPGEADEVANECEAELTATEKAQRDEAIATIARTSLDIETLETRNSNALDFHDIGVWAIRAALEQAYQAGRNQKD